MSFVTLQDAKLAPDPTRYKALEAEWAGLATSGPMLSSVERIAVAATARDSWAGGAKPTTEGRPSEADLMAEAAYWLAVDAGGLSREFVVDLERRGLDPLTYLEVVGIVSRLATVDFYTRGLGAGLLDLPESDRSSPTANVHPDAEITTAWVPTAGQVYAPAMLDALPDEGAALRAIHEPFYMPMAEMSDGTYEDTLTRMQIEYVAARSSYLNECFY